jgi:hypothetical protein
MTRGPFRILDDREQDVEQQGYVIITEEDASPCEVVRVYPHPDALTHAEQSSSMRELAELVVAALNTPPRVRP